MSKILQETLLLMSISFAPQLHLLLCKKDLSVRHQC